MLRIPLQYKKVRENDNVNKDKKYFLFARFKSMKEIGKVL